MNKSTFAETLLIILLGFCIIMGISLFLAIDSYEKQKPPKYDELLIKSCIDGGNVFQVSLTGFTCIVTEKEN